MIDGHALETSRRDRSDHSDTGNHTELLFAASQMANEVGITKQQANSYHEANVSQIGKPESRSVGIAGHRS